MNNFINKYKTNQKYSNVPPETELCELFYKYGADKCPQIFHTYSKYYFNILNNYKDIYNNILEIGIGNLELMSGLTGGQYQIGPSLKAWRDFFKNARVFGLDIRTDVLFSDERIECFYTDQSDEKSLIDTINNINHAQNSNIFYDFIIDDGSHHMAHQILTFKTLLPFLNKNGIYIIEDIHNSQIDTFAEIGINNNVDILYKHVGDAYEVDSFIAYQKKYE
jgi:hypothetical protein